MVDGRLRVSDFSADERDLLTLECGRFIYPSLIGTTLLTSAQSTDAARKTKVSEEVDRV